MKNVGLFNPFFSPLLPVSLVLKDDRNEFLCYSNKENLHSFHSRPVNLNKCVSFSISPCGHYVWALVPRAFILFCVPPPLQVRLGNPGGRVKYCRHLVLSTGEGYVWALAPKTPVE